MDKAIKNKIKLQNSMFSFMLWFVFFEATMYLSNDAYLPALIYISRDLNISHHLTLFTVTIWFIGSTATQLFLGPITERFGYRTTLLSSGVIFILSTLGCALTHNISMLLILRFIQGASTSPIMIAGYSAIHKLLNREEAIYITTILSTITILTICVAPLFGAIILNFENWHWIFGILANFSLIFLIGLFFKMPETEKNMKQTLNIKQTFMQFKKIISNKSFLFYSLLIQSSFLAAISYVTVAPILLINRFHFTTFTFALLPILMALSYLIGSQSLKIFIKTKIIKMKKIIQIGLGITICSNISLVFFSIIWPEGIWKIISLVFIGNVGWSLVFSILNRLLIESSDESMGAKMSLNSFMVSIAASIGSVFGSTFYNGSLFSLSIIFLPAIFFQFYFLFFKMKKYYIPLSESE